MEERMLRTTEFETHNDKIIFPKEVFKNESPFNICKFAFVTTSLKILNAICSIV